MASWLAIVVGKIPFDSSLEIESVLDDQKKYKDVSEIGVGFSE